MRLLASHLFILNVSFLTSCEKDTLPFYHTAFVVESNVINSVEYVMLGSVRPVPSLCASHFAAECVWGTRLVLMRLSSLTSVCLVYKNVLGLETVFLLSSI